MAQQTSNGASAAAQSPLAAVTAEIVTQLARSAAGELVKGQQPLGEVAKTVAGEAVETLDKRGPELAEDAGIMNWRYATLGWITWQVGKRVLERKAHDAVSRMTGKQQPAKGAKKRTKPKATAQKAKPELATETGGSDG
jgi:hypothetical protein